MDKLSVWGLRVNYLFEIICLRPNTTVKILYPIISSGINPSIGIGPSQGQRKTLTRVGFEPTTFGLTREGSNPTLVRVFLCPCVGPIPILGLIPDGIIGYKNFTVVLGLTRTLNHYSKCYWRTTTSDYLKLGLGRAEFVLVNNISHTHGQLPFWPCSSVGRAAVI